MQKIGITGGIGTGKSTVCKIFTSLGIPTFDADKEAKALYDKDEELKADIISRFGDSIYKNGKFQKSQLAKIVFNNETALKDLNELVHPKVIAQGEVWFALQKAPYAIKEAALLIESGGYKKLDKLIVVKAPLAQRIARVKNRDGLSQNEIEKRINRQWPESKKESFADYKIKNGEDDFLIPQVLEIHEKIIAL
jgi:dephospho-CoA kinase